MFCITTGTHNTAIGYDAGNVTTGTYNTAIGDQRCQCLQVDFDSPPPCRTENTPRVTKTFLSVIRIFMYSCSVGKTTGIYNTPIGAIWNGALRGFLIARYSVPTFPTFYANVRKLLVVAKPNLEQLLESLCQPASRLACPLLSSGRSGRLHAPRILLQFF